MPYLNPQQKLDQQRARRAAQTEEIRARYREMDNEYKRAKRGNGGMGSRQFRAVDGEGGGTDELGRQNYLLLRAGENLLFNGNLPLTTDECLGFLSGLPPEGLYVAYYFDYDVTMILRDASYMKRERILKPHAIEPGQSPATFVGDYLVEYMPHKYFKVKHKDQKNWITINEVGPFFQCAFAKAITDWQIGTEEERQAVHLGKARRKDFELMTDDEIKYNEIECRHLEQLMEDFRDVCRDIGCIPPRWQGPGYLASTMMKQRGIPKRKDLVLDNDLLQFTNAAYYGGRFELFKIGTVKEVREYDINSAYPTAMLHLPCLQHGEWTKTSGDVSSETVACASVRFSHNRCAVANLPIRDRKSGTIQWPYQGNGVYWSWEIEAARQAGTNIEEWRDAWVYKRLCDCHPFDWVNDVYLKRKAMGKSTKGYALKLAINSLYGKTAQSIGTAPFANPIWAGLITAYTRAKLIDAYRSIDDRCIVMLATDGIYTTCDLDLPLGGQLGEWEYKLHDEMFLVQPGIYFMSNSARPKTRGVPMAAVLAYEQQFRDAFNGWDRNDNTLLGGPRSYPSVKVPLHAFIGLKLAQAWHKPQEAGKWVDVEREISFDFRTKREFAWRDNDVVHTFPLAGGKDLYSTPYARDIGAWRADLEVFEAIRTGQPDYMAFAPHEQLMLDLNTMHPADERMND